LVLGIVLVSCATFLGSRELPGAVFFFLLGAVAILAGMVGLGVAYLREKAREAIEVEELPPPRVHRRASCRIEQDLLEKLALQVEALRLRADEKHWEPDWSQFDEHRTRAEEFLQGKDLAAAFREYCRAMLPLTRALQKQRHKEEVFQPVWDRTH
jgi:hypothetical protein